MAVPHQSSNRRLLRRLSITAPLLVGACVSGCSEPGRTVAGYCAAVDSRLALVVSPTLVTSGDVDATLAAYREIAAVAPAAIEPEWSTLTASLETAATVTPGDPESLAAATDAALASTPAATRIQQYTREVCAIDIGTPPPPTNPVTATTAVPTSGA